MSRQEIQVCEYSKLLYPLKYPKIYSYELHDDRNNRKHYALRIPLWIWRYFKRFIHIDNFSLFCLQNIYHFVTRFYFRLPFCFCSPLHCSFCVNQVICRDQVKRQHSKLILYFFLSCHRLFPRLG